MQIKLISESGKALAQYIPDLARLRIEVFREYPYLYDGNEAYEQQYLQTYIASGRAMAVLALDGDRVIGASTGIPMADEDEAFKRPFQQHQLNPETIFYCGESVLLPEYRGQGIYKRFFAGREQYVRALGGFSDICFCAVVRADEHPLRPADYQPLDAVWRHFGFAPQPQLLAHFNWQDIDQHEPSSHPMMFWMKRL